VSFEELQSVGEEKDTSILDLQLMVKTARADLEKEKKQVEGKSPPSTLCLSISLFCQDSLSTYFLFALRPADHSRDVNDTGRGSPGEGAPGGLRLLPAGAGGFA
jgi:hypothetical protein